MNPAADQIEEATHLAPRATELLRSSLAWDNHACMPLRPGDKTFLPQLSRHREAGFDIISLNVGYGDQTIEQHILMLAAIRGWVARHPDHYVLVKTIEDIARARTDRRLGIVFDIEGMGALGGELDLVQLYYDLGVRWMLVAYNKNNLAGGGCQDEDTGLTAFGRQVVTEMARVGMVCCLSHTGHRTAREVIDWSPNPVIFSHSNPAAVSAHPRNIPDELMRDCAARRGVIGINGIGMFLGDNDIRTETFVRHVDHAVQIIGDDHVALGLDHVFDAEEQRKWVRDQRKRFPDGPAYPDEMHIVRPEQLSGIGDRLQAIGYADQSIRKILGLN